MRLKINAKNLFCIALGLLTLLSGCSTVSHRRSHYRPGADCAPDFKIDVSHISNAVPKVEKLSKYGNPASYKVNGRRYSVLKSARGYDQTGIASWYGMKFYQHRTSSGETYNVAAMTAASKVLPLPTYVSVTNLKTRQRVIVKVNDRGPFHENRIIDLSYAAAAKLNVLPTGTALVEVKAIDPAHYSEESSLPASVKTVIKSSACASAANAPKIYLQLGAFRIEANARRLEQKVKEKTYFNVVVKTAEKNGTLLYRVQIGPISDVDNTDALYDKLRQAGLGEPVTVIQIQ